MKNRADTKQRDHIKTEEYYREERAVSLMVPTNIRRVENVKNANLILLT
jgi:hypothetical protein